MGNGLHIGLLVEQRYQIQAQPSGMRAALQADGHQVTVIDPDAASYEMGEGSWLDGLDLVVARGRSWALQSLLSWAESRGLPTINSRAAIAAVHNKADMAIALAAANLPTPRTFFGPVPHLVNRVPRSSYPLILKPIFGDNCQGLRIVHSPDELAKLELPGLAILAQRYLPSDGYDLKLYAIGDEIWAVRKPSPFSALAELRAAAGSGAEAELLPLTPSLETLGRRCGALFSLKLYGVDCIQTPDGPVVIEVNDFPNYTGVPDADKRLADYVVGHARKELGS